MPKVGSRPRQIILITLGVTTTFIGVIGIVVPALPVTPFFLVSLWAFSQSSQKLYSALWAQPFLKPFLEQAEHYQTTRTIKRKTKIIAQAFAWSGTIITILFTSNQLVWIIACLTSLGCTAFMIFSPTAVE